MRQPRAKPPTSTSSRPGIPDAAFGEERGASMLMGNLQLVSQPARNNVCDITRGVLLPTWVQLAWSVLKSRKLTTAKLTLRPSLKRGHASRSAGQTPRVPRELTRVANSKIQVLSGMLRRNTNLSARLSVPSSRNREISTATPRRRGKPSAAEREISCRPHFVHNGREPAATPLRAALQHCRGCIRPPKAMTELVRYQT